MNNPSWLASRAQGVLAFRECNWRWNLAFLTISVVAFVPISTAFTFYISDSLLHLHTKFCLSVCMSVELMEHIGIYKNP